MSVEFRDLGFRDLGSRDVGFGKLIEGAIRASMLVGEDIAPISSPVWVVVIKRRKL